MTAVSLYTQNKEAKRYITNTITALVAVHCNNVWHNFHFLQPGSCHQAAGPGVDLQSPAQVHRSAHLLCKNAILNWCCLLQHVRATSVYVTWYCPHKVCSALS